MVDWLVGGRGVEGAVKPRIYWSHAKRIWVCYRPGIDTSSQYAGFGDTPEQAYADWMAR
jgi:hypothetical protein